MTFPADLLPHLLPDERELLERAQAAPPGPWSVLLADDSRSRDPFAGRIKAHVGGPRWVGTIEHAGSGPHFDPKDLLQHIAATNPAAVIELLTRLARERASRA